MRALILAISITVAACGGGGVGDTADFTDVADDTTFDPLDPSFQPPIDENPGDYPANVWVTDGMAKVQPDGATPGNEKWALLWSAKNEVESFQVHVQNPTGAAIQVTVSIAGDLFNNFSGTFIPADSVTVYREEYLDITTPSDANGLTGRVPDALIPTIDPIAHEARDAFPVTIPPGETRSAWIDVLVPQGTMSGYYQGSVNVTGGVSTILPFVVGVWDLGLPSTSNLASGFGSEWNAMCVQAYGSYDACGAYPGAGGDPDTAIELTHVAAATALLDYRISDAGAVYYASGGDWTHFDSVYGPLLDGTAATRLPGARLTHLWYTGGLDDSALLADWTSHFAAKGWLPRTSAYYCDEPPNGCSFSTVTSRADFIHGAAPNLQRLLTTDLTEATDQDLLDRIEIMVPIVESMENRDQPNMRDQYDAWLAGGGKTLWWYQSCDEHESCSNGSPGPATATWPSYMVDASPVRNRVFQWLAYLYGVSGELYYATEYCWTASCGGQSDPWVSLYAFGGNGDGTLYYPGTPAKIGGSTPVPVPSIRLALIRDGMEDYELLHELDRIGRGADARSTALSFITNNYTFDNDPAALQAARKSLGDMLHHVTHP